MTQPFRPKNYQEQTRYFLLNGGHGLIPWCWHLTFQHANEANQRSLSVVADQTGDSRFSNQRKTTPDLEVRLLENFQEMSKTLCETNRVSPSTIEEIWVIRTYSSQNLSINARWPVNQEAQHNPEKTEIREGCKSRDLATCIKMIRDKTYSVPNKRRRFSEAPRRMKSGKQKILD